MGIFNKIGEKASEAYGVTAKKTGELAKEAKLRLKINECKSDINDLYKEIGKKVYEKHVREDDVCVKSQIEEECSKIDALTAEIESNLKTILELKNKKLCIKCHAELELDAVFCSKCGERQPEVEVIEAEVVENVENSENTENNEDHSCCEKCDNQNEVNDNSEVNNNEQQNNEN